MERSAVANIIDFENILARLPYKFNYEFLCVIYKLYIVCYVIRYYGYVAMFLAYFYVYDENGHLLLRVIR